MKEYTNAMQRIQDMIYKIQQRVQHDPKKDVNMYYELIHLCTQKKYVYGEALGYVNLAQAYQILQDEENYICYSKKAKSLADENGYDDILVEYYILEGLQFIEKCDDMNALRIYLEGVEVSLSIKDYQSTAIFFNNIAEIFYDNKVYEEAQHYYLQALDKLENISGDRANVYRTTCYINLISVSCYLQKIEEAHHYLESYQNNHIAIGILPLAFSIAEIRLLLAEHNTKEANQHLTKLLVKVKEDLQDPLILQPIYLNLMEILLLLKHKEDALWCLNKLKATYKEANQYTALCIQKYNLQYEEIFKEIQPDTYQVFYEMTILNEALVTANTAESFHSFITLYNAEKEHDETIEQQTYLETLADKDELTHIYNRRYYSKLISKCFQNAHNTTFTYIMIDVDHFKEYNDCYGHLNGDMVLQTVADVLYQNLAEGAYASRYGGDEFSCFLINKNKEQVTRFIEKVQSDLAHKQRIKGNSEQFPYITLSFGVYMSEHKKDLNEQQFIEKADIALYEAKKMGRNTFFFYENTKYMESDINKKNVKQWKKA